MKSTPFLMGLLLSVTSVFCLEIQKEVNHGFSLESKGKTILYLLNGTLVFEEPIHLDDEPDTQFAFDEDLERQNFQIDTIELSQVIPKGSGIFDLYIAIKDTNNVVKCGSKRVSFNDRWDLSHPFVLTSEMRFLKQDDYLLIDRAMYASSVCVDGSSSSSTMSRDSSAQPSPATERRLKNVKSLPYHVGVVLGGNKEVVVRDGKVYISSSVPLHGSPNIQRMTLIPLPESSFLRTNSPVKK